ncbi:MAG: hypothetical protein KAT70_07780, partial [Thermoplasmata archaeon]|nr:hypothetical protein [Thermoplasmata archaeon]
MTDDSHAPQQTTKKVEKTAAKDEKQPVEEKKETAQAKPVAAKTVAPKKQEVKTSDADEPSPKGGGVMGG